MTVPIVSFSGILIVPVQSDLTDADAIQFREDLGAAIERHDARAVLIDVSLLDIIDSFFGRLLNDVVVASRLLGAHTVVLGMRPAVATTLVELGLSLEGVQTALNVEKAIELLRAGPHHERGGLRYLER